MRKIIGNHISVYLKTGEKGEMDIFGLLLDVSDDSVFLQVESNVFIVPRDNVNYYVTDMLPTAARIITPDDNIVEQQQMQNSVMQKQVVEKSIISALKVYIDNVLITGISVPPTFDLQNWHEGILRVAMGNAEVRAFLVGKAQKEINYAPGMVHITTVAEQQVPEIKSEEKSNEYQASFSMGGDPSTQFVNPLQMVTRLQNYGTKKGNNNDENKA